MKTTEVNKELIGRRCECISFGTMVTGVIEWIDGYESTRFTQIGDRTAVVTFEYNMASVREWLARHTEIETCKTA